MSVTLTKTIDHDGYWIRLAVAADEFGAAAFGIRNNVTLSSWCEVNKTRKVMATLGYWVLDKMQYKHCESAVIHDKERDEDSYEYLESG